MYLNKISFCVYYFIFSSFRFIFPHTKFFKHEEKFISSFNNSSWLFCWNSGWFGLTWCLAAPRESIPRYSKITTRKMNEEDNKLFTKSLFFSLWKSSTGLYDKKNTMILKKANINATNLAFKFACQIRARHFLPASSSRSTDDHDLLHTKLQNYSLSSRYSWNWLLDGVEVQLRQFCRWNSDIDGATDGTN